MNYIPKQNIHSNAVQKVQKQYFSTKTATYQQNRSKGSDTGQLAWIKKFKWTSFSCRFKPFNFNLRIIRLVAVSKFISEYERKVFLIKEI